MILYWNRMEKKSLSELILFKGSLILFSSQEEISVKELEGMFLILTIIITVNWTKGVNNWATLGYCLFIKVY